MEKLVMSMDAFKEAIVQRNTTLEAVCDEIGISRSGVWKKFQDTDRWKVCEVITVIHALKLTKAETKAIFGISL